MPTNDTPKKRFPLTEEDVMDLHAAFKQLYDFVEKLTGILYDNTELPANIRDEIENLYAKEF